MSNPLNPLIELLKLVKLLVFDFDGTVTKNWEEALPFKVAYVHGLAVALDKSVRDTWELIAKTEQTVLKGDPAQYGWIFQGTLVSPATGDPYVLMLTVSRLIWMEVKGNLDTFEEFHAKAWWECYPKADTVFQPGVEELFRALKGKPFATEIVTNSGTGSVRDKLNRLGREFDWLTARIHGGAKKNEFYHYPRIDETSGELDKLPLRIDLPGFGRRVEVRRRQYFSVLNIQRWMVGADWSEICVVGDNLELDGLIVLLLGGSFILMMNEHTPQHEIEYVRAHPRGHIVSSLVEIQEALVEAA
ncbi:HAD family hydrolase [Candidatus Uhrbacteria bacterium]|nr:HAD family hydrolase [Candidatus Uhrbacteria bacterium]